ncbi:hypothetical protein PoMZ_00069 [Pyricularia oryzae]|uniref:Uncharacterized protein n=1 Tax=Pyricularia oryzae TaxID=318829 RepID=A0A4P7N3E7_PYROR|nr:hypothetical protein PoMZ_00069 [Pyricularia oryzae]
MLFGAEGADHDIRLKKLVSLGPQATGNGYQGSQGVLQLNQVLVLLQFIGKPRMNAGLVII